MMSREELHIRQHRDRLLALAETTQNLHKPMNVKRRSATTKSPVRLGATGRTGPKLSIQVGGNEKSRDLAR